MPCFLCVPGRTCLLTLGNQLCGSAHSCINFSSLLHSREWLPRGPQSVCPYVVSKPLLFGLADPSARSVPTLDHTISSTLASSTCVCGCPPCLCAEWTRTLRSLQRSCAHLSAWAGFPPSRLSLSGDTAGIWDTHIPYQRAWVQVLALPPVTASC